jgi:hypothetical protein
MTKTAATTADAEHALLSGDPSSAIAGLAKATLAAK